jgi:hypothetical protein
MSNNEMDKIEEIKQTIISNRVIQIIIAVGTSIAATCAGAILLFIWNLRAQLPTLQQQQEIVNKKIDDMQESVNGLSKRLTFFSDEQIRQGEKINFIQSKIK